MTLHSIVRRMFCGDAIFLLGDDFVKCFQYRSVAKEDE